MRKSTKVSFKPRFTAAALAALMLLAAVPVWGCTGSTDDPTKPMMTAPPSDAVGDADASPKPGIMSDEEIAALEEEKFSLPFDEDGELPESAEIWDGSIAESLSGIGTSEDPYLIRNGADLALLAKLVNEGRSFEYQYIHLANDIYLNDPRGWENWDENPPANEWTAIGCVTSDETGEPVRNAFSGAFDGRGYTIYGLYINKTGHDEASCNQGLFGLASEASLDTINVKCAYVNGYRNVGCIAGTFAGFSIFVYSCTALGTVRGESCVGGLVGFGATIVINDSYAKCDLEGESCVGGFFGKGIACNAAYSYAASQLFGRPNYAFGTINGEPCENRLFGQNSGSQITEHNKSF